MLKMRQGSHKSFKDNNSELLHIISRVFYNEYEIMWTDLNVISAKQGIGKWSEVKRNKYGCQIHSEHAYELKAYWLSCFLLIWRVFMKPP